MPEVNLGSNEPEKPKDTGRDLSGLLDDFEQFAQRMEESPELRKMFGIESPMQPDNPDPDASAPAKDEVDAEFLADMLEGMIDAGYGDFSIDKVHKYVTNNPGEINAMLQQYS